MTTPVRPGSVKRMPGHLRVSTACLWPHPIAEWDKKSWRLARPMMLENIQPYPYRFCAYRGIIYYVDGRKQVYETDIASSVNVLFNPVGYQMNSDLTWSPIQFRLMDKVEWMFL